MQLSCLFYYGNYHFGRKNEEEREKNIYVPPAKLYGMRPPTTVSSIRTISNREITFWLILSCMSLLQFCIFMKINISCRRNMSKRTCSRETLTSSHRSWKESATKIRQISSKPGDQGLCNNVKSVKPGVPISESLFLC